MTSFTNSDFFPRLAFAVIMSITLYAALSWEARTGKLYRALGIARVSGWILAAAVLGRLYLGVWWFKRWAIVQLVKRLDSLIYKWGAVSIAYIGHGRLFRITVAALVVLDAVAEFLTRLA